MIRWILLLQEFNFEVKDPKVCESQVADHLFHFESNKEKWSEIKIDDTFFDELDMVLKVSMLPWYTNFSNYVMSGLLPDEHYKRKHFLHDIKIYYWDEPYSFWECTNKVIPLCYIIGDEVYSLGTSFITCFWRSWWCA